MDYENNKYKKEVHKLPEDELERLGGRKVRYCGMTFLILRAHQTEPFLYCILLDE